MFRLNTMQTGAPGGQDSLKLDNYPDGFLAAGLLLRFGYPVTTQALAAFTAKDVIEACLASFTLRHGLTGDKVAYSTVPGADMRNVHRFITREELPNNAAAVTGGAPGAHIAFVDLFVPFAVEELVDGRMRCPGWSQSRTMILDVVEGPDISTFGGNVARTAGANMLIDVDVLTYPSELDQSGPILSYYRANQAALRTVGPDGVQLAAWEASAAQANTAITLYSMNVSSRQFVRTVPPYVAGDKYQLNWDTGISPITDEVTMGWSPDEGQGTADLQSGEIDYVQASQDVPLLQLRGLYWPPMQPEHAREWAQLGAKAAGGPIVAALPAVGDGMPGNVVRTLHAQFHKPGTPGFTLTPASLIAPDVGAQPFLSIPESVSAVHGSVVNNATASGPDTTLATQSRILDQLTRRVPGLAQLTHGDKQTRNPSDPKLYLRALDTVAGSKGQASLNVLKSSLKL